MAPDSVQRSLFKQVKAILPTHLSLPEEVAQLLGVSSDSAYRRIRGEKLMDIGELMQVAARYGISLDALLAQAGKAFVFQGRFVGSTDFGPAEWLQSMNVQLEQIASLPDPVFIFRAEDIPSFHHFQIPELALFKLFFWRRTILNDPAFRSKRFDLHDKDDTLLAQLRKVALTYKRLPTTEIWNADSLNAFLRQVAFYHEAGLFVRDTDVEVIHAKVLEMIDHLQHEAEAGVKFMMGEPASTGSAKYTLYLSETMTGDNMIHATGGGRCMVFINHSAINYISTSDPVFCEQTHQSIRNVMEKSVLISGTGEKVRNKYFRDLRAAVAQARGPAG